MRKKIKRILILLVVLFLGIIFLKIFLPKPEITPEQLVFSAPIFISEPPPFEYKELSYQNPQYTLPLANFPENYQKDLVEKLKKDLTQTQKNLLLSNGVLILEGPSMVPEFENFDEAYQYLAKNDIPIFISADYILHFFHITVSQILENIEVEKLSHMLEKFLEGVLQETEKQYEDFGKRGMMAELARRNMAYLSLALKLLDPSFKESDSVKDEVKNELNKIEGHKGLLSSEIFNKDCSKQCQQLGFSEKGECIPVKKGEIIYYQEKNWDSLEFYKEVCLGKCYCEDYSYYLPQGHYTLSKELENYYKATTFLSRVAFKLNGENWTRQALLLTLATHKAKIWYKGKEVPVKDLWKKIYATSTFFPGGSDSLNFYDYSQALNTIISEQGLTKIEQIDVGKIIFNEFRLSLGKLKGAEIFEDSEIDLKGNLKELKKGLTILPKSETLSLESQIFNELTYENIGPNPDSPHFREVQGFMKLWEKFDCDGMKTDIFEKGWSKEKYWQEICQVSLSLYEIAPLKLYSLCKLLPLTLELTTLLGSKEAEELLNEFYQPESFCDYQLQKNKLKEYISTLNTSQWTQNLDNLLIWQFQSLLKEKPQGFSVWLRSDIWGLKNLITSLSSFSEIKYDPALYRKEKYETVSSSQKEPEPLLKYSGFLEPNPEFYARIKYVADSLIKGLEEQDLVTGKVFLAVHSITEIAENLQTISEKELRGTSLGESDYNFIKELPEEFKNITENLASVLIIKEGSPGPRMIKKISLEGKEEAFKTNFIRDIFEEQNLGKLLHTGTGKLDWLIVVYKKDGKIIASVGPIFSFYEFAWPKEDRLTNEKWRQLILKDMKRPIWYSEIGIRASDEPYIVK